VNELAKNIQFNEYRYPCQGLGKLGPMHFLPFKPGLVGGHCIGVDPYYLAQKSCGGYPEIILAGRRFERQHVAEYVASQVVA
jgi:UDP-N-acetyl-D-galactosamine dehydrogenase